MARDFSGTNQNIRFGSDASIATFAVHTVAMRVKLDTAGATYVLACKEASGNSNGWMVSRLLENTLRFRRFWSTTNGTWVGTTLLNSTTAVYTLIVTYDTGGTSNDPVLYINGTAETFGTDTNPTGTVQDDVSSQLSLGETSAAANDLDGQIGWFCYDNRIWDAGMRNRYTWWGRPDGAVKVFHPLTTNGLTNQGTATATGTASGATVDPMVAPVVRPGSAMMGMGVGW